MRFVGVLLLAALTTGTTELHAQSETRASAPVRLEVAPSVALGNGPSATAAVGVEVALPLSRTVLVAAEASRWASGIYTSCLTIWPAFYRCTATGTAFLLGLRFVGGTRSSLRPYAKASGGVLAVDARVGGRTPAASVGAGATLDLSPRWALEAGVRHLRAFNATYKKVMEENLSYTALRVGIRYRLAW